MPDGLYHRDFYAWTRAQADILRTEAARGNNAPVDWENVAEELDSMGRGEWNQLESRLTVLIVHLLKLLYAEDLRERNARQWWLTIREQRRMLAKRLRQSPSLRPVLVEDFGETYTDARETAADETDLPLDRFPIDPPFTYDQALDPGFLEDLYTSLRR
ncbi:MAG: hypothetical protein RLY86_785 [Pseudomonadota bacterium]|jgi:hypothetical protein